MSHIADPGRLIAEILAELKPPHRTAVAAMMRIRRSQGQPTPMIERVLYGELPQVRDAATAREMAEAVRDLHREYRPDFVVVILVDDIPAESSREWYRQAATAVAEALAGDNGVLGDMWQVNGRAPGSVWFHVIDDDHGLLPEVDSPFHSHAQTLAHDPDRATTVAALLPIDPGTDDPRRSQQRWQQVMDAIDAVNPHDQLTARELAQLADALADPDVRHGLFALALSSDAMVAARLWTVLIRALPAGHRARPALLLALTETVTGDHARAHVALAIAHADRPPTPDVTEHITGIGHHLLSLALRVAESLRRTDTRPDPNTPNGKGIQRPRS